MNQIIQGDCLEILKTIPDNTINCCVTSPPYWGLRNYNNDSQLGLEKTPEEYVKNMVKVFREVKRVLKAEGTLWLSLGDSYAGSGGTGNQYGQKERGITVVRPSKPTGLLKPKDLVGIPWAVAKALREPYYLGKIKNERDRIYLAATMDSEGTICGYTHLRKDNQQIRRGININITNSNLLMLDECQRIWETSKKEHNTHGVGHFGKLDTYRWVPHGIEDKQKLIAELYPYLICKKKQAIFAWNFLEISKNARGRNKGDEGKNNNEKCQWIVDNLSLLNHAKEIDIPSWMKEIPSMFEPGWYLRQDIIWHKPNPMPESVKDRCTKNHEYLFLLSKSQNYYYDNEAIKTVSKDPEDDRGARKNKKRTPTAMINGIRSSGVYPMANKRSVWTVATKPFNEAHFATYPPELIEDCILAGCPVGGVVLDPFFGAGTTGLVAMSQKKSYIGIELNPEYIEIAKKRINGELFKEHP